MSFNLFETLLKWSLDGKKSRRKFLDFYLQLNFLWIIQRPKTLQRTNFISVPRSLLPCIIYWLLILFSFHSTNLVFPLTIQRKVLLGIRGSFDPMKTKEYICQKFFKITKMWMPVWIIITIMTMFHLRISDNIYNIILNQQQQTSLVEVGKIETHRHRWIKSVSDFYTISGFREQD